MKELVPKEDFKLTLHNFETKVLKKTTTSLGDSITAFEKDKEAIDKKISHF